MLEIFLGTSLLAVAFSFLLLTWSVKHGIERLLPREQKVPKQSPVAEEMPASIRNLIDLESEAWAQQDLEIEAARLWAIHEDWAIVHTHLLQQVGEPPAKEATDRAWSSEPEVVDMDSEPVAEGF